MKNKRAIYGSQRCDVDSSSDEGNAHSPREKEEVWLKPVHDEVKIIDFGGATYEKDHHTAIINTRQYRAPEVILSKSKEAIMCVLGCQPWDMKSDIWSMACILAELYTGEMFFSTHENTEHLAMMETVFGPFPRHMAERSSSSFRDLFHSSEEQTQRTGHRLDWPKVAKRRESIRNVEEMLTLNVGLHHLSNNPRTSSKVRTTWLTTRPSRPSFSTCSKSTPRNGPQLRTACATTSLQAKPSKMRHARNASRPRKLHKGKRASPQRRHTSRTSLRHRARVGISISDVNSALRDT